MNSDQQSGFGSNRLQGRSAGLPGAVSGAGNGEEAPSGRQRLLAQLFERKIHAPAR